MRRILRKAKKAVKFVYKNSFGLLKPSEETIDIIEKSGLFDLEYYNSSFLKKEVNKREAISHYLASGLKFKYEPNPFFNSAFYLEKNPDVKNAGFNPFVHYILYGGKEGRNPNPDFDGTFYLVYHADVRKSGMNPLYHYINYGRREGRLINKTFSDENPNNYTGWVKRFDIITDDDVVKMKAMISSFKSQSFISVITPVYNPDIKYFRKAIDSIIDQAYSNWELCLADDASTDPEVKKVLEEYVQRDKRIKVTYRKKNGHISEATNSALEIASGEFVALFDQDDELPRHTLFMIAKAISEDPELCLIYSDEDKMDMKDNRTDPYFKSNWNKDLLYGHHMICHLDVYRTSIAKEIGGFRKGFEGSQDYDFTLRYIEKINVSQIKHIPHVLYHWRTLPGSTAHSMDAKSYAYNAALKGLSDHLKRTGQNAKVIPAPNFGYRVKWNIPGNPPLVSVIIPWKDEFESLKKCLKSVLEKTNYRNFEIIIVCNKSDERFKKQLEKLTAKYPRLKILTNIKSTNYPAVCNAGAKEAKGEIIGFLSNNVEVINETWLSEMVSHAIREEVGAVGAKMYDFREKIFHSGIILGINKLDGHMLKGLQREHTGYFNKLNLVQNLSALSGDCLFMKKSLFLEAGRFDETNLKTAYSDIDLCLRLRKKGYINVWTPFATLYCSEPSFSEKELKEKNERSAQEVQFMFDNWKDVIENDPYYNPNLSVESVEYKLAVPPRLKYPWK